jgi:Domain of unknown function (DUF4262)
LRNWFRKDGLSKIEREIISNVDLHGCHLNGVFDPDGQEPSFVYSIGFTKTMQKLNKPDFPEVIICGLPGDYCGTAINELLAVCAAGQELHEEARIEGFFGDYDGIVRMVHQSRIDEEFFNSAIWYHRTQMNRELEKVAMLVWPDANGVFPWEDGCEVWVKKDQPALYEARLAS